MAIAAVRILLKTVDASKPGVKTNALFKANHDKYIMDADIKGFFDNINHS
jgi:retron-type reverse transcriptase